MATAIVEPFGGMGWFRVGKIFINEKQLQEETITLLRELKGLRELRINSDDKDVLRLLRKALPEAEVVSAPVITPPKLEVFKKSET